LNWNKIKNELRVLLVLIIVAFTIKTTLIEIYVVPTGSMEDTILTGDMLIGNKFIYGMRTPIWIGVPYTRIGFSIPWLRLPPFKNISNGDVTIFEFPRDPFQKYVKRCIGIAGDTVSISGGTIFINKDSMHFPIHGKYIKGYIYDSLKVEKLYPYFKGNRDNISEFIVPYKGMEIDFSNVRDWQTILTLLVQDGNVVKLGEKLFTMIDPYEVARTHGFLKYKLLGLFTSKRKANLKEQRDRTIFIQNLNSNYKDNNLVNPWHINFENANTSYILENITINGFKLKNIQNYKLKNNYYFFIGDNRDSSYDSRFWGFVPDKQILGTPLFSILNLFKFKLRMKVIS
tara:strand:+ start:329 stop:1357 length:1029 start_codon:yes stop_codon:yes gene_type:complete